MRSDAPMALGECPWGTGGEAPHARKHNSAAVITIACLGGCAINQDFELSSNKTQQQCRFRRPPGVQMLLSLGAPPGG